MINFLFFLQTQTNIPLVQRKVNRFSELWWILNTRWLRQRGKLPTWPVTGGKISPAGLRLVDGSVERTHKNSGKGSCLWNSSSRGINKRHLHHATGLMTAKPWMVLNIDWKLIHVTTYLNISFNISRQMSENLMTKMVCFVELPGKFSKETIWKSAFMHFKWILVIRWSMKLTWANKVSQSVTVVEPLLTAARRDCFSVLIHLDPNKSLLLIAMKRGLMFRKL